MILSKRKTNSKDHMVERSLLRLDEFFTNRELYWDKEVLGYPGGTAVKKLPTNAGDVSSVPGPERSPGNNLPPKAGLKRTLA